MAWVSLNNLTRFYTKLKEKFYLKTEIDTKVNTLNTAINNISTVYYGDGVDSAIAPLNADQLQGHPASYFATTEALANSGLKMDLLWTNADPYSDFIAQTLNLGVKNYKLIIMVIAPFRGNINNFLTYVFVTSIKDNRITVDYYSGTDTDSRGFSIKDDSLSFNEGAREGTANSSVLIPYQIYGVR